MASASKAHPVDLKKTFGAAALNFAQHNTIDGKINDLLSETPGLVDLLLDITKEYPNLSVTEVSYGRGELPSEGEQVKIHIAGENLYVTQSAHGGVSCNRVHAGNFSVHCRASVPGEGLQEIAGYLASMAARKELLPLPKVVFPFRKLIAPNGQDPK